MQVLLKIISYAPGSTITDRSHAAARTRVTVTKTALLIATINTTTVVVYGSIDYWRQFASVVQMVVLYYRKSCAVPSVHRYGTTRTTMQSSPLSYIHSS